VPYSLGRDRHGRRLPARAGGGAGLAGVRPLRAQLLAELDRAGDPAAAGRRHEPGRGHRRAHQPPLRLLPAARPRAPGHADRDRRGGAAGGGHDRRGAGVVGLGAAAGRPAHQGCRRGPAAKHQLPPAGRRRRADGAVRAQPAGAGIAAAPGRRHGRRPLMAIALLFLVFAVLLVIGVPVAFALAAAALATLLYLDLPSVVLVQQVSAGTGSASLLAIPLFIFAGEIMMRGGISERLIALAASLVGRMRGGLGQVSILSSLFFGGVSGSAIADVSAVGGTMIPQMVKRGYDRDFAVNVSITAALVALLVPPSHNLILFSAAAGGGLSIADLFAAGIVPALMMTATLMTTGYLVARRRGYGVELFPGWRAVLLRLVAALPGLGLVTLIFVGIRAGIFTAVE